MSKTGSDKIKKAFRVIKDLFFRCAAHGLSSVMNQLVYLPAMARMFSSEVYGLIQTVIGLVNFTKDVLGSSLNNIRLTTNDQYEKQRLNGDFNLILSILLIVCTVIITVAFLIFPEIGLIQFLLLLPTAWLLTFDTYATYWYYLSLDLKKTFFNSIVNAAGLVIGLFLVNKTGMWPMANLVAAILVTIYLVKTTPVLKEKFVRTPLFTSTFKKLLLLSASSLLSSLLIYLDKLLLYPIIGGTAVSTYSTAVFFGKTLNIFVIPASSVLLGYFSQHNFRMDCKKYWLINGGTWVLLLFFVFAVKFISPAFTRLFFPTLYEGAAPYLMIANLAASIGSIAYITQAVALKYASTKWILIIQIIYSVLYIGLGIPLLTAYGLIGFCWTVLITNCVKLLILYAVCHYFVARLDRRTTQ